MSKPKSLLKVRITNADHAMEPSGTMDNTSLPKVPIIRIYGLSSMGHKTCVHVHLTWPYLYVEYKGSMTPDAGTGNDVATVNKFSSRLLKSLNHAVAISLRKNPADVRSKYIRAIHVVKGVHLYGFHCNWTPFLKIYIIDPQHTIRIATILRSGGIMQQKFQVFESHLSYLLQFMCDFGLYGCGELEISEASVRQRPVDPHAGDDDDDEVDTSMFSVSSYPRISTMALELDVLAYHILNPLLLAPRNIHNTLNIPGLPLPSEPLVLSVRELWEDERKRRVAKGLPPTPSMPASVGTDRSDGPGWRAEPRLRSELNARIEKAEEDGAEYYPDPSVRAWEDHVMTAFESRGSLWPPEHRVYKPATPSEESPFNSPEGFDPTSHAISRTTSKVDDGFEIDEVFLTSQGMDNLLRTTTKDDEGIDDDDFQDDDDVFDEQDDPSRGDGSPKKRRSAHSPTKSLQNSPTKGSLQHSRSIHQTPSKQATGDRSSPFRRNLTPSKSFTSGQARANPFREQSRPVNEESLISPTKVPRRSASAFRRSEDVSEMGKSTPSHATASNSSRLTSGRYSAMSSGLEQYYSAETSDAASVHIGGSGSSQEHTSTTGDGIVGSMHELGPKDGKDPRASPSPILGQQRLSGAISSGTGPSSGEPALEKKNVANVGLGMKGVTWPDSLGSFQSPTFSSQRGTLSSPQATDTRLRSETSFTYPLLPPTSTDVLFDITERGLKDVLYRDPYYSNLKDVPKRSREYAGRLFTLKGGTGVGSLPPWDDGEPQYDTQHPDSPSKRSVAGEKWGSSRKPLRSKGVSGWEYAGGVRPGPPSRREIERWLEETDGGLQPVDNLSRRKAIIGPTQRNRYGFQVTQNKQPDDGGRERQNMSVLSIEVFSVSRGSLLPNPEFDRVECILFAFQEQDVVITDQAQRRASYICGCMAVESEALQPNRMRDPRIELYENELDLFNALIDRVKEWDPDVLTGWELQNGSWGVPHYSAETLSQWFKSKSSGQTSRVLDYSIERAAMVLDILDETQVVTKNAEFARVFGVEFFSVLSRGSQFKVESFMFRIAKPESLMLLSPSREDVGRQNAAECIPLIMEPKSAYYKSPLVVLDFQSLYPSIMIAYNYCYTTCLGRVGTFKGKNKFGVLDDLKLPDGLLGKLKDHIQIAPNGIMYVTTTVRKSLLAKMLTELLDTRVMVKQAMKTSKDDKALLRVLDARQLSLKFICNVTYGYTSASFSGRMPGVEIADSIVQSGRETLEKAITTINTNPRWGAKVVYGDTDSLFVSLEGKTKEQAFRLGNEMADAITAMNPKPVKLKFEKVYFPCLLMAKKRYVGFKYEHPDDKEPVFDAKGIETVRRDGIPAGQKMVEKCLKILFRSQDLSEAKAYCQSSWQKLMDGRVSLGDFVFAKEVKLGKYSDKGPPPPGVVVAARRVTRDPRAEAQYGDRVPYVIVRGEPKSRLVDRAFEPLEVLKDR
ncbi:DNA polymerase zeta [Tulasnella sp. 424]|nr:DNA polymerase zeta [Tulasnella sp. 424]